MMAEEEDHDIHYEGGIPCPKFLVEMGFIVGKFVESLMFTKCL